jgi:hypothetical protein
MKHIFLFLVILAALVIPVSAANITITAEPLGGTLNILTDGQTDYTVDVSQLQRDAIQRLSIDVPTGSHIDYAIWFANGSTATGHMIYEPAPGMCGSALGVDLWCQFSEVSIASSVANHYYVGAQEQGRIDIVGYGRNEDTQERVFIIYDSTAGIHIPDNPLTPSDAMAYTPVSSGVIYKFHLTSNKPITSVAYYTNTRANVDKASRTSLLDTVSEFWALLNQIKDNVIAVFWFGYDVAIFLWDNLWLIIPLYFSLTGVMAVFQAKGKPTQRIFKAMKVWFGYQRSLLNFILGTWDTVIGLITKILK